MPELFKTVLTLSLLGFGLTALLLFLKPVTSKKFPAKWQYCVWVAVLLSMIIPAYKLIPAKEAQKMSLVLQAEEGALKAPENSVDAPKTPTVAETPAIYKEISITKGFSITPFDFLAYVWFFGMSVYFIVVVLGYIIYLVRIRKKAVVITDNPILNEVKKELKIGRRIKIKTSPNVCSPMLISVFLPTVYVPCREIPAENMRMVLLHELMHYKRKDLLVKWLSLFVNAVHWFNPLAYLLCASLSEACEVSCDMAVTKNMSETEQKIYMKTILDLVDGR